MIARPVRRIVVHNRYQRNGSRSRSGEAGRPYSFGAFGFQSTSAERLSVSEAIVSGILESVGEGEPAAKPVRKPIRQGRQKTEPKGPLETFE
jgi:hypothetical protein